MARAQIVDGVHEKSELTALAERGKPVDSATAFAMPSPKAGTRRFSGTWRTCTTR